MKNVMALVVFSMLTGQIALAAKSDVKCLETNMSIAAKKIRLSGKVLISECTVF